MKQLKTDTEETVIWRNTAIFDFSEVIFKQLGTKQSWLTSVF